MAEKTSKTDKATKKNSGTQKQKQRFHPDGTPVLPGFFDDYGGSGVVLLGGGNSTPKKPTKKTGKKK